MKLDMDFHVNAHDVALVHRLRRKYAGNEVALDALLYHALSQGGRKHVGDAVRESMAFYATPEGEAVYAEVVALLDPATLTPTTPTTPTASAGASASTSVYEYSNEWTKALKRKQKQTNHH